MIGRFVLLTLLALPSALAQAGDLPTLRLEDTPEIPAELEARLGQYLHTRSASLVALARDGEHMLVGTRFAETTQLHRVDAPGGARTQLTFMEEPLAGAWELPGDETTLLVRSDVGGTERYQVSRMDLSTGRMQVLTDPAYRHSGPRISWGGDRLAWSNNAHNGTDTLVYLGTSTEMESNSPLFVEEGYWNPVAWTRDDQRLVVSHYISSTHSELFVVDLASSKRVALHPPDTQASVGGGLPSLDGSHFFVRSDHEGGFNRLYRVTLEGRRRPRPVYESLTSDVPWDVEGLALSPDGATLAFTVNENGWSTLWLLDTATGEKQRLEGAPQGQISGLRYAREAPVLGFSVNSPTAPRDPWTWGADQGFRRWVTSEVGGLDSARFVAPELIHVTSFDGTVVPAWLYLPPGEGPHPVVIGIHGGPESQARPRFHSTRQYLLLESGIASIVPNVRGSRGYGRDYLLADNGEKREDSVRDIGAILDWIAEQPELDADRVAVTGGSYGGYMVLASLVHYSDRLVGGVDVVGISNFVTFLENTKSYRRDLRRVEYGDERDPQMRSHLESISPANQADRIQTDLFVAHGANDPRVPLGEAEQIVDAVRANGQDVWLMVANNEGHGFRKKENSDIYRLLYVLFLEEKLLQDEVPQ